MGIPIHTYPPERSIPPSHLGIVGHMTLPGLQNGERLPCTVVISRRVWQSTSPEFSSYFGGARASPSRLVSPYGTAGVTGRIVSSDWLSIPARSDLGDAITLNARGHARLVRFDEGLHGLLHTLLLATLPEAFSDDDDEEGDDEAEEAEEETESSARPPEDSGTPSGD